MTGEQRNQDRDDRDDAYKRFLQAHQRGVRPAPFTRKPKMPTWGIYAVAGIMLVGAILVTFMVGFMFFGHW